MGNIATRDIVAECKNKLNNLKRPCAVKICNKCLLNRYGEKVEEVATSKKWSCPRCRGICNCSICMKRRGRQPTGILSNAAKATGFSSVSEMLLESADRKNHEDWLTDMPTSIEKEADFSSEKENSFAGKLDAYSPKSVAKNSKNVKGISVKRKENSEGFKDIHDSDKHCSSLSNGTDSGNLEENKKRIKRGQLGQTNNCNDDDQIGGTRKLKKSKREGLDENGDSLPVGTDLTSVAEINMSAEDIGNALQFLEFCSVFEKILDMKIGEAESVLEDVIQGGTKHRGKSSLTILLHKRILLMIETDRGEKCEMPSASHGKNSWFSMLKKCLSESKHIPKAPGISFIENTADYESLSASEKLRVLNLLCDEVLGTEKVRRWIELQNFQFREKKKGAKKALSDAKGKDIIVSRSKSEAAQAHAQLLESNGTLLNCNQACDAMRIEPILIQHRGRVYWKLNCFGETVLLHQNVGKGNSLTLDEKWFTLDDEGKKLIEKYISSLRSKK